MNTLFTIAGFSVTPYNSMYILGFVAVFVFNTFYGKKYGITRLKSFLLTLSSYVFIYVFAYLLAWAESGFKDWGHHNAVRVYVWMPVIMLLTSKIFTLDWRKSVEFITSSTCIVYGIARIGCLFPGCCHGYPCSWGIYSAEAGERVFPVQLCESLTALAIAAIILVLAKKRDYSRTAKLYPLMLILYGSTRFIWEFFCDNEKIFLGLSSLAMHAALMVAVGTVSLIVLTKKDKNTN